MAEEERSPEQRQADLLGDFAFYLRMTGRFIAIYWKILFALIWPLIILPFLIIYDCKEMRCAFVVLIMAGYWITDCFPMAVTALIPVVMFPSLGVLSTRDTCICYMNDTIMVFLGGLILAIAIEHSNLHMRIALGVLRAVGASHAKLLGGLCAVTTFISMWVANTAATAMMVPIIFAVLRQLETAGLGTVFVTETDPEKPDVVAEIKPTRITKAYFLAAAYCSTFGGTGTLVGTGTNLTLKGIFETTFPESEGIIFTTWLIASFPQMVVNSFLCWLYLQITYFGFLRPRSKDAQLATIGPEGEAVTNRVILENYRELGPMSFHETGVAVLFFMCVFLWIFRKPGFVTGWAEVITDIDLRDSVPVIFAAILMFFIPKDLSFLRSCSRDPAKRPKKSQEGLITWKKIETKMPWSLMFLLGGGFAIAKGSIESCMAKRVGMAMLPLRHLPPVLILTLVGYFVSTITEFTSNVGIANITLPVIAQMCIAMEIHPLYLMVPATLCASFSFRLPVGTPPNAIVTVQGHIPTKGLIAGGCVPAIYSVLVQVILFPTWGAYIFEIDKGFPEWAAHMIAGNDTDEC